MRIANLARSRIRLMLAALFAVGLVAAALALRLNPHTPETAAPVTVQLTGFDGARAYRDVATQIGFGPRTPGSPGHAQAVTWMLDELRRAGWEAEIQEAAHNDYTIQNVVARRGQGRPWVIFGAHYDTRFFADNDPNPENRSLPVPGANDGASGVAVLLELARSLPHDLPAEVWLVLFDAEDQGRIAGWDWILGSHAFVAWLDGSQPDAVVIADMIGDANLEIYQERNSDAALTREIWGVAETLGYVPPFVASPKYRMLDDHIPFLRAGIPAVDLIDFDYPAWHTVEDTPDQVAAQSLQAVGDVLTHWLLTKLTGETAP